MVQELEDLKKSIIERRYQDALKIVDDLEEMGKQAILRNIESFLVRLFIHLIKNQLENRLTNSWVASISDSIVQIKKLNLKDNKKSYYLKETDWESYLEEALELAIRPVSIEVFNGKLKPAQISLQMNRQKLIQISNNLINLTYGYQVKELPLAIDKELEKLPGGKEWFS